MNGKTLFWLFAMITLSYGNVYSESRITQEMQQAKAYFDAEEYDKAKNLYQQILQEPLTNWQRAVVMYDLSSTLIGADEWGQAIATLQTISIDNALGPVLNERIQKSIMLAYIREAQTIAKTTKNYPKAMELLKNAIDVSSSAQKANCDLQQAEGLTDCQPSTDVEELKSFAQKLLEALKKMPPPPPSSSKPENAPPENKDMSPEQSSNAQQQEANNVLQLLLQMDQDDRMTTPTQPLQTNELRPW